MEPQCRKGMDVRVSVEIESCVQRHTDGMRSRLRGYPLQAAAVAVDPVELPLDGTILERSEVDPVLCLIDPDHRLAHPIGPSKRRNHGPFPFGHLVDQGSVCCIAIEVHEAIALRRPEEVTVTQKIQVVVYIDPLRVSLREQPPHLCPLAIG